MNSDLPSRDMLERLLLRGLLAAGGELSVKQMLSEVARQANLNLDSRPKITATGNRTDLDYKLAWARTSLKKSGHLERVAFGKWRLTPRGEEKARGL